MARTTGRILRTATPVQERIGTTPNAEQAHPTDCRRDVITRMDGEPVISLIAGSAFGAIRERIEHLKGFGDGAAGLPALCRGDRVAQTEQGAARCKRCRALDVEWRPIPRILLAR